MYSVGAVLFGKGEADAAAVCAVVGRDDLVVKVIPATRDNLRAALHQVRLQRDAAELGVAPTPHSVTFGPGYAYIVMDRVGMSIADMFGEDVCYSADFEAQQPDVCDKVRAIITTLAQRGLAYNDRAPYNFMLTGDDDVRVIDFEHVEETDVAHALARAADAELWNADFR